MGNYQATGAVPGPAGSTSPAAAPYEAFATSDQSWVLIAAGNDRLYAKLCSVLGCSGLASDPRFAANPDRVARRDELHNLLESETRRYSADELLRLLQAAQVPASRINTIDQVFADEQVNALEMFPPVNSEFRIPEMKLVDIPVSIDGRKSAKRLMPPRLGEHTDTILRKAGYSSQELQILRDQKVIK
jgi:crotonobetainyl-CoA:carnitine CoA-transferase CaiB-like acyl-CoA transferase